MAVFRVRLHTHHANVFSFSFFDKPCNAVLVAGVSPRSNRRDSRLSTSNGRLTLARAPKCKFPLNHFGKLKTVLPVEVSQLIGTHPQLHVHFKKNRKNPLKICFLCSCFYRYRAHVMFLLCFYRYRARHRIRTQPTSKSSMLSRI